MHGIWAFDDQCPFQSQTTTQEASKGTKFKAREAEKKEEKGDADLHPVIERGPQEEVKIVNGDNTPQVGSTKTSTMSNKEYLALALDYCCKRRGPTLVNFLLGQFPRSAMRRGEGVCRVITVEVSLALDMIFVVIQQVMYIAKEISTRITYNNHESVKCFISNSVDFDTVSPECLEEGKGENSKWCDVHYLTITMIFAKRILPVQHTPMEISKLCPTINYYYTQESVRAYFTKRFADLVITGMHDPAVNLKNTMWGVKADQESNATIRNGQVVNNLTKKVISRIFVYAKYEMAERRPLWDDLMLISNIVQGPRKPLSLDKHTLGAMSSWAMQESGKGWNEQLGNELINVNVEHATMLHKEEVYWREQSRVIKWLADGDANTCSFHKTTQKGLKGVWFLLWPWPEAKLLVAIETTSLLEYFHKGWKLLEEALRNIISGCKGVIVSKDNSHLSSSANRVDEKQGKNTLKVNDTTSGEEPDEVLTVPDIRKTPGPPKPQYVINKDVSEMSYCIPTRANLVLPFSLDCDSSGVVEEVMTSTTCQAIDSLVLGLTDRGDNGLSPSDDIGALSIIERKEGESSKLDILAPGVGEGNGVGSATGDLLDKVEYVTLLVAGVDKCVFVYDFILKWIEDNFRGISQVVGMTMGDREKEATRLMTEIIYRGNERRLTTPNKGETSNPKAPRRVRVLVSLMWTLACTGGRATGGVIVMWDKKVLNFDKFYVGGYYVSVCGTRIGYEDELAFFSVYESNEDNLRQELWEQLRE
ncbi:hypothetical protein GIB67_039443 [Kingdonia uniflora]|uniref:Uncharacterized protein n=1 Tax=Kingdonia uniflora TaxID=39325 RepID=A0A7J7LIU8_9MAGN|nr:hypothetical protein GIB67_039443 [Kingdonia uniflora]